MGYRAIINNAERQRNARVRELLANRTKVSQNQNNTPPTRLSAEQMDKVKELVKEGLTREEAVKWALDNIKSI